MPLFTSAEAEAFMSYGYFFLFFIGQCKKSIIVGKIHDLCLISPKIYMKIEMTVLYLNIECKILYPKYFFYCICWCGTEKLYLQQ